MALSDCDPFSCPQQFIGDELSWRLAVLIALSMVSDAVAGGGGGGGSGVAQVEATWVEGSIDATTLTGSFQNLIVDTHDKVWITVYNRSDETIEANFDGGTSTVEIGAWSSRTLDLGSNNRFTNNNVRVKHSGTVPTTGTVYGTAYY